MKTPCSARTHNDYLAGANIASYERLRGSLSIGLFAQRRFLCSFRVGDYLTRALICH